ncbi:MAG: TetR/AcrR family transcriptional regulator [Coprococcus sp.]|jgi:AcrR family transcriptional regulator|nr:TetR/AcrR family transcriptional regulator [Coprococcus sp.]
MGNRKEEILIAALNLFARDGYEAVSVSQIAGELGMTKGALYRRYKSKKNIFNCIVEWMKQQDSEQASDHDMPEDDKERMPEKYETVSLDDFVKYNIMKENIDFYGKSGFRQASEYGIRYHGLPEGYLVDEQEVEEFDRQLTMFFSIFK